MTSAQYTAWVVGKLRRASMYWKPKNDVKKEARIRRGENRCAGDCGKVAPNSIYVKDKDGNVKKKSNIFVDHIEPIVDPEVGFTNFHDFVHRLYCEKDNLQVLCRQCHDDKTNEERSVATERKAREKKNAK